MATSDYTNKMLHDKYLVVRLLGEGGMGSVYLGQHVAIGKPVAIKFLHADLAMREDVVKRFYREAQAAATIRHRNIIDVVDLGVSEDGDPYLVMEYLEGEGLGNRIERAGPLDLPAACGILEAALVGLEAAHEKGIVHRDLKPDNIFLVHQKGEPPAVKLIDFGISKFVSYNHQTKLTQDGSMLGTPAYMSPEQARGLDEVDHRADLYSVGVIMFEMLTGGLPFSGSNYNELLINVITTDPADPHAIHQDFPEQARPVIAKALSKDPGGRFQSAHEMLEAVRGLTTIDERIQKLTLLSGELDRTAYATGDLGKSQVAVGATRLASEVFMEMMGGGAPIASRERSVWFSLSSHPLVARLLALIIPVHQKLAEKRWVQQVFLPIGYLNRKTARYPIVRGIAGVLVIALAVALWANTCSDADDEVAVLITVKGAPNGSKIFYDDSLVPMNPFRVKRGEIIVPLRVEVPGEADIKISVIPSENQVVQVKPSAAPDRAIKRETRATKTDATSQNRKVSEKKTTKDEPTTLVEGKESKKRSSGETKKTRSRRQSINWPWRWRN